VPEAGMRELFSLHKLPTDFEIQIDPTGNVLQLFKRHPSFLTEASINFRRSDLLKRSVTM
jgi:hypothetical protein